MAHSNELVIQKLLGTCAPECLDAPTLNSLLDEHAVYHVPGWNALSGEYRGRDEIVGLMQRRMQFLQKKHPRIKYLGTSVSGEHVAMLYEYEVDIRGKCLIWRANSVYFIKQGKVVECWLFVDDEEVFNAFWEA